MTVHQDLSVSLGDDHVARIEIKRGPENFIDASLARGIADAIEELDANLGCRAIILASEGKHFCAGARLDPEGKDIPQGDDNPLYDQVSRMVAGSVPIVAAVQGAAIGAGLGLALIADFRIASTQARFGATFSQLGFHPGFGISATLPLVVGQQHALEMLYTGRRLKGDEAFAIGLCDQLVAGEAENVQTAAHDFAKKIAASAPLSLRAIRRTMRGQLREHIIEATRIEHAAQQVLGVTLDYAEGLAAAADRRAPRFIGR